MYVPVNDGRSAVPCAYSYFLFDPEDQVMEQNLLYYKAYSEQWGLQPDHLTPRPVREKLWHHIKNLSSTSSGSWVRLIWNVVRYWIQIAQQFL